MKPTTLALILAFILTLPACAPRAEVKAPAGARAPDSVERLRDDLGRIFDDPAFALAQWGAEVVSLESGDTLYSRNANKLYMPASNNKVLTGAAALVRLGPAYRFGTRVFADGVISDGVLRGRLRIEGAGDPSIAARFGGGDVFRTLSPWADRLREKGVRRIEGGIVADEGAFEDSMLGTSWEWDDLAYGYAAPVSALQFNENVVNLQLVAGGAAGDPIVIRQSPIDDYLVVDNRVTTAPVGTEATIEVDRVGPGESVRVRGRLPAGSGSHGQAVAVRSPSDYFLRALRKSLAASGIECAPCDLAVAPRGQIAASAAPLFVHESPELRDILKPLLKVSQNLYAETFARTLGLAVKGEGSFARGKEVVEDALRVMGIEPGTYFYADGSGLSRRNLVSADVMIRILKYMHRHRYSADFHSALPVAGVDGTISERMKGTRAEKNAHAKTGSIAYVRSLSGYVTTADGELLAFSFIANHFLTTTRAAEYVQDAAVERLAGFSRK
jgi:serine-type D-Ala-D-Ala carboxypeptidase/endopeptidase (penicillin-binding protein 4)